MPIVLAAPGGGSGAESAHDRRRGRERDVLVGDTADRRRKEARVECANQELSEPGQRDRSSGNRSWQYDAAVVDDGRNTELARPRPGEGRALSKAVEEIVDQRSLIGLRR